MEAALRTQAGHSLSSRAHGQVAGGVGAGHLGLGLAGVVWVAGGVSSGSVRAREGDLAVAVLAVPGAVQAPKLQQALGLAAQLGALP